MILIGQNTLTLEDFSEILNHQQEISLADDAIKQVAINYLFLKKFSSNKLIYGINTGFGPMAQYKVNEENILQLQYNLIRSHSSGSGKIMTAELSKAVMVARFEQFYAGLFRCACGGS